MLSNLSVPGVYVQEVSTLPPTVAAVPTAIPAFIGFTQRTVTNDALAESLVNEVKAVRSLREFEAMYGQGAKPKVLSATLDVSGKFATAEMKSYYYLYDALRLFYQNGGGKCYVVSVGAIPANPPLDNGKLAAQTPATSAVTKLFTDALDKVAGVDEPTLLLFPDAANFPADQLALIQQAALAQCGSLQDRFVVCDSIRPFGEAATFRSNIGQANLKYGAAYAPWLLATSPRTFGYADLHSLTVKSPAQPAGTQPFTKAALTTLNQPEVTKLSQLFEVRLAYHNTSNYTKAAVGVIETAFKAAHTGTAPEFLKAVVDPLAAALKDITDNTSNDTRKQALHEAYEAYERRIDEVYEPEASLRSLLPAYGAVANGLEGMALPTPPSGAVAGVMARTDRQRGVWKAPANESISGVVGPTDRYTNTQLGQLNVDVTSGKSINAIRAFTGRGTLIFGSRTLAGNSGDDRYVNVRRTLIFLEESIKKACEFFVFEPNDANTWLRVRGMVENFLNLQWRAGALQGATPEEAFKVNIGLGSTMSATDVLDGRMIVTISLALVRPAEFIVLRFSQQQAQS